MTTTIQLSPSQHALLDHAAQHTGGIIEWFPDNLKGGARSKVLEALEMRGLVECVKIPYASSVWQLTDASFELMGTLLPETKPEPADKTSAQSNEPPVKRTRAHSKQAQVIALLHRPEGATISKICEATGWQSHTVRGTFAGAFKKKLGLDITSVKELGRDRVYLIA